MPYYNPNPDALVGAPTNNVGVVPYKLMQNARSPQRVEDNSGKRRQEDREHTGLPTHVPANRFHTYIYAQAACFLHEARPENKNPRSQCASGAGFLQRENCGESYQDKGNPPQATIPLLHRGKVRHD